MSERKNLPSASGLEQLALCPGSWNLQRGIPDSSSPEADSGTRIHAALAGEVVSLTPEEQDIADSCREIEKRTLDAWAKPDEGIVCKREERMWLKDGGAEVFSGKPDVIYFQGKRACYLDYKTGRSEQTAAAENFQLTATAVLIGENPRIEEVTCGIIAPLVTHKVDLVVFDRAAINAACDGILASIAAAMKPDAPLAPGEKQCRWCRAQLICPAVKAELKTISEVTIHEPDLVVSNEDLGALLDKCGRAMKLIAQIGTECRRRLEAGQTIPGWELVDAKGKRKVSDVVLVGERLAAAGAEWKDIAAASTINIGAVKTLAREASKKKGKDLATFVDSVLNGATSTSEAKKRLKRIGAALEDEDSEEES